MPTMRILDIYTKLILGGAGLDATPPVTDELQT